MTCAGETPDSRNARGYGVPPGHVIEGYSVARRNAGVRLCPVGHRRNLILRHYLPTRQPRRLARRPGKNYLKAGTAPIGHGLGVGAIGIPGKKCGTPKLATQLSQNAKKSELSVHDTP